MKTLELKLGGIRALQADLQRAKDLAQRAKEHAERRADSAGLAKYLRTNRDRFMDQLWEQVTGYASEFASTCTGGYLTEVRRSKDGGFSYVENGYEDDVISASGAQRSIMAIGIQLALDTLLPGTLGVILLDEPTADLNQEHSAVLTQALAACGRQVIMVSHREMDSSSAQGLIQVGQDR